MSTVLTNGIIIPDNGSRNWGGDLANNWNILDVNVGYMNDVKTKVTTLENSVAENTANIQINASNISALQTSKQDVIEDLETIRTGASAGATAVQPSGLNDYYTKTEMDTALTSKANDSDVVHNSGNETVNGVKSFSNDIRISKTSPFVNAFASGYIKGQAPTSNIYSGARFFDDINSGSANTITGGFEIEYNRDGYNKSYISSRNYAGENHKFFNVGLRVPNDDTRSIDFLPSVNGIVNLGTSSNKWKTLNGINPGALSLPSSNSITIDTSDTSKWFLDATTVVYTPTVNGWLTINVKCSSANNYISVSQNGLYNSCAYNPSGYMRIMLPVYVGKNVEINAVGDSWGYVRLFPCQGNV